ncbi:DUF3558 family protein [Aldersonia kunmingensis]|uniref:DUF3558 family protein n=1 Tax=Aldersonia kunmingensis TaxID=408066 RepID=UPI00082E1C32|nr:DUF3558 family protein [Aldersonia kunmingensis]
MPKIAAIVLLTATLAVAAGCADQSAPTSPDPANPAAPTAAPTAVTPAALADFDPCTDIDDNTLRLAGLNPSARQRVVPASGEITATCRFDTNNVTVAISNSTQTFEQFRDTAAGKRVGIDIDTRPTVIARYDDPNAPCEVAMKTQRGIVLVVTQIGLAAREWGMDRCGGARELATTIEPTIGQR